MYGLTQPDDVEESNSGGSSDDLEQEVSLVRCRGIAVTFGVLAIGAIFTIAAVGVYPSFSKDPARSDSQSGKSTSARSQQALRSQVDQQFVSSEEPPMTIAKFVTTRRLSMVAAPAFDAKCPMFQPKCDLVEHFNSLLEKELKTLSEHDPEFAKQLYNTTVTPAEQRIIMELLPAAHNKSVISLGQLVASTVKRWASKGEEVVHEKVREALAQYSKDKGIEWNPPANTSKPGAWKALMHPKMLALIGGDNDNDSESTQLASRRLFFDSMSLNIIQGFLMSGLLLRLVLFVFQILHKTKTLIWPHLWMKAIVMWGNLIGGGLTCIATILLWCPILFLQYWFNAWLLFSNTPKEMDDWRIAPFGAWMRHHLPGFKQKRLLLAMDSRMAA